MEQEAEMANLHQPKLSASRIKTLPAGKYTDGHGLMLWVKPTGTRSWVQRIVIQGKRRDMGLGAYPLVSLAEAREMAFANRKIARAGGDPRQQAISKAPTFADATKQVHAIHAPTWKNDRQRKQWPDEVKRIVSSAGDEASIPSGYILPVSGSPTQAEEIQSLIEKSRAKVKTIVRSIVEEMDSDHGG